MVALDAVVCCCFFIDVKGFSETDFWDDERFFRHPVLFVLIVCESRQHAITCA